MHYPIRTTENLPLVRCRTTIWPTLPGPNRTGPPAQPAIDLLLDPIAQVGAQPAECARHMHFHGFDRDMHDLGNLCIGESMLPIEDENLAAAVRKGLDCLADDCLELVRMEVLIC